MTNRNSGLYGRGYVWAVAGSADARLIPLSFAEWKGSREPRRRDMRRNHRGLIHVQFGSPQARSEGEG